MNDDGDKYRGQEITIMKIKKDLKMGALAVFLTLALVLVSGTSAYAQTVPLEELDAYIEKAMDEWEVPGLAIAIVENDTVVFARGYGVREISDPTPVDEHTVFAIGSATKSFTSASVAMLVDEGKLEWDGPVTNYLPGFQMFDSWVTRQITVRDLLTHDKRAGENSLPLCPLRSRRNPVPRSLYRAELEFSFPLRLQ